MKIILSLCDLTGNVVAPWVDDGYHAILVDPQHDSGIHVDGHIMRIGHIIDHPKTWKTIHKYAKHIKFMSSFPPCTDLAVSGARWLKEKGEKDPAFQFHAMQVVWQCHVIGEMLGCPYFIENPVSQISSFWRKPDHWFHPYQYTKYCKSDNYTKKTCLWTGNGFIMPPVRQKDGLPEPDDRIHKAPPGKERANFRSATPSGFSIAVHRYNRSAK